MDIGSILMDAFGDIERGGILDDKSPESTSFDDGERRGGTLHDEPWDRSSLDEF
jgi:hypothetical protein